MDPRSALEAGRNDDGGFGPIAGATSEPEATAMAAIALGDPDARRWLEDRQGPDGSVGMQVGPVFRDVTALASLAMDDPASVRAAVARVLASQARSEPTSDALPHDPSLHGWAWTSETFGWIEPTAWAVLALRIAGESGPELDDGVAVMRDRACVRGGWNYGNRLVLGEALWPYVQTTALALLALHGIDDPMVGRGIAWLESAWRHEAGGSLSLAVSAATLRRYGSREAASAISSLGQAINRPQTPDTVTLAWASIALGSGLGRLEVA